MKQDSKKCIEPFLQHLSCAAALVDAGGRLLYANPSYASLCGRSLAEMLGGPFEDCLEWAHSPVLPVLHQVLTTGRAQSGHEVLLSRLSGNETQKLRMDCFPLAFPGGEGAVLAFYGKDGTESGDGFAAPGDFSVFRQLIEGGDEIFWVAAADFSSFSYVSPQCERWWGVSTDNLRRDPRRVIRMIESSDRARFLDFLKNAARSEPGREQRIECRMQMPDGIVKWIMVRTFSLKVRPGSAPLIAGSFIDMTGSGHYRIFMEAITSAAPGMVYIYDIQEMQIVYRSGRGYELLGYPMQVVHKGGGRFYETILHPEDAVRVGGMLKRWDSARDQDVIESEYRLRRADGAWRWFRSSDTVYSRDASGRVSQIVGMAIDITEAKQIEENRRHNDERFRKYFEQGLIGVAVTAADKRWIDVNKYTCEMLGYTREELLQRNWAELTCPEDLAADVNLFNQLLAGDIENYQMDKRFLCKDGGTVFVSMAVTCIRKPDGSVDHVVALMQDITERKKAENELHMHREHLEEMVRDRTRELEMANEQLKQEIVERKVVEENLQKKNIALREILSQIEIEKKAMQEQICANVERLIIPTIKKIRMGGAAAREDYLSLVLRNLQELTSGFGREISSHYHQLTPREIEICNMIKSRLSNKEIAKLLSISPRTVETHRNDIRRKLKLAHKRVNLATYLQSL